MTTSGESRGSAGRGLPVGWEWRPRTGAWNEGEVDLYPPGADVGEERATVYPSGKWETWEEGHSAQIVAHGTAADGAAAQVAAEAALWATDGYGTGEVRGLRLPLLDISAAAALVASRQTVTLPGLSGWWIVRAARCDGGADGVEVDAVRAPVEDAPPASMSPAEETARDAEPLHPDPAIAAEVRADMDEGRAIDRAAGIRDGWHKGEPSPREPSAPTDPSVTCSAHWFGFRCNLDPGHRGEHAAGYVQLDGETGRVTWEGGSIPREEPSAPADGAELARLLPMLPSVIDEVRALPHGREAYLADACSMLLAERERMARDLDALRDRAAEEDAEREATRRARAREREADIARILPGLPQICEMVRNDRRLDGLDEGFGTELAELADAAETMAGELAPMRKRVAEMEQSAADAWAARDESREEADALRARAEEAERERDYNYNLAVHVGKAFYATDRVAYGAAQSAWHEQTKWTDEDRARLAEMLRTRKERTCVTPAAEAIETTLADEQSLRNWLRIHGHGAALDAGRSGVEVAIGLLSAPPPHTAAALLARVGEARKKVVQKSLTRESGHDRDMLLAWSEGLREAASLIRATLAPSPLDGAVAEVCALLPREYPEDPHGLPVLRARRKLDAALADLGEGDALGARVSIVDAMADLLAGMLAADAPPAAPIGPRCRHCRAALGAEHTKDCVLRWKEVAEDEHETTVSAKACDAPATKEPDK